MDGSDDNFKGLVLAVSSSVFIGSSFIIKKKGLRAAGIQGLRAGSGGFSYLREPLWWAGMLSLVVGEVANFAAYAFAPAILVTPLGALSVIVSAVLAHYLLQEKLNVFGVLGCMLCIVGSVVVVLHAPEERQLHSVIEIWMYAMRPGFLTYATSALTVALLLIWATPPEWGTSSIFVYVGICSLMGSLSVVSCKALGIALRLTFDGNNQLLQLETGYCIVVRHWPSLMACIVAVCVVTQMNYLNKALDLFNTAIVSPIYYVMFTTLTVTANVILFQEEQGTLEIISQLCGFVTIVGGTFLLHATRDMNVGVSDVAQLVKPKLGSPAAGNGLQMQSLPVSRSVHRTSSGNLRDF